MRKYIKYILTFFTEFIILFLGIVVYKIVNERFDDTEFSEYNLFRRSSSLFQPLIMCGLGVSIPKFISKYVNRNSFLIVGLLVLLCVLILTGAVFLMFEDFFAQLLFGNKSYANLIFVLLLILLGAGIHAIVYGFLRGKFLYGFANLFQLFNIGIVPVLSLFVYDNIIQAFYFNGLIWIISSLFVFLVLCLIYKPKINKKIFRNDLNKLLFFGLPRIPGDFALLLLLSMPSFIVLHFYGDIILAGYVAFATTLINLVGAAFGPIGLILLPETNRLIRNKQVDQLQKISKKLTLITLLLVCFGFIVFVFFPKFFLDLLVSDSDYKLVKSCVIMLIGAFGYAVYLNLRSILDAFYFKPVNSFNLLMTLIFLAIMIMICWFMHLTFDYILYSFALSMTFLGALTYLKVVSIFKTR